MLILASVSVVFNYCLHLCLCMSQCPSVGGPAHSCTFPYCLGFVGHRIQQQTHLLTPDLLDLLPQLNGYNMSLQALTVATTHSITEPNPNMQYFRCFSCHTFM